MTAPARFAAPAPALALLAAASVAHGQSYDVTPLESLGEPGSWAWSISNTGLIVGHAFTEPEPLPGTGLWLSSTRAVLWSGGSAQELGTLVGGSVSIAHGVNDEGQVVGRSREGTAGPGTAFSWSDGQMTPLPTPADHESEAFAVNDAATAVGSIMAAGGSVLEDSRAVRWQDGAMLDLHDPAWQSSAATAVNAAGVAAGWYTNGWPAPQQAVIWAADGTHTDLGTLGTAPWSVARAISDAGVVVGHSGYEWFPGNWVNRAFIWQDGQMDDLGALGGNFSEAYDVNASGLVVGTAETATGDDHAFLWNGQQMLDLNDLIPADSGWQLVAATGINDEGAIVGYGMYGGEVQAFQLASTAPDPCPADITGDGTVDVMDLVQVITSWGDCPPTSCLEDVDHDATIGVGDLSTIFAAWGDCPNT